MFWSRSVNYKKELKNWCKEIDYNLYCFKEKRFELDYPHAFFAPSVKQICIYNWNARDIRSYFSGLHEVGHVKNNHIVAKEPTLEKQQEIEAWDWALGTCKVAPDEKVAKMIQECLRSYCVEERRIERLLNDTALYF